MKIESEIKLLDSYVTNGKLVEARKMIERNLIRFGNPKIRQMVKIETLTLINSITAIHKSGEQNIYSRETRLIIQHINRLASDGRIVELKRYANLQKEIVSNPNFYKLLSVNAKALIIDPSLEFAQ